MRHVETVLLNKLKGERDETMTPINVLINYTYRELLTTMDRVKITEDQVRTWLTITKLIIVGTPQKRDSKTATQSYATCNATERN